jgi:hypothetical protein
VLRLKIENGGILITVIEAVGAFGQEIPPMIIMKGENIYIDGTMVRCRIIG